MALEIERKFLVKSDYKAQAVSHTYIKQGYIFNGGGRTVRVRLRDHKAYLTIKGPSKNGGLTRYEFEKEITFNEGLSLMMLCEPGIIEKNRWLIPIGKHTYEVDEFFGENEGLTQAEVELSSENETFEQPDFLGKEVTGDKKFYNSHLRKYPYCQWTNEEKGIE